MAGVPLGDYVLSGVLVGVLVSLVGVLGRWVLPLAQRLIEVAAASAEVMRGCSALLERVDKVLDRWEGLGEGGNGEETGDRR